MTYRFLISSLGLNEYDEIILEYTYTVAYLLEEIEKQLKLFNIPFYALYGNKILDWNDNTILYNIFQSELTVLRVFFVE